MNKRVKDMSIAEKRKHYKKLTSEWRKNNPEKNRLLRKKYKNSKKGKEANKRYTEKNKEQIRKRQRDNYAKNPEGFKQDKEYIKEYMKQYLKDKKNHHLYLIRQRAYSSFRENLIARRKKCEICGAKQNLEIHHKEYINKPEFVILLCRKCHRILHRK